MCDCVCVCGARVTVRLYSLASGNTTSCGCARRKGHIKHGGTKGGVRSPTWLSWTAMRQRCNNERHQNYANYGGRGIRVCARWNASKTGFAAFVSDMGKRPEGCTLDRIDNDLGYEPGNCRWSTRQTQEANKRSRQQYVRALWDAAQSERAHWDSEERKLAGDDEST